MVSGTALGLAAGICGTLFIVYCVYFDQKRRKDPEYKKKIRERRRAEKLKKEAKVRTRIPDLRNYEETQAYFLHEVQVGEHLLGQGDFEGGVEHLGNAVAVCGRPNKLLKVLQETLPPNLFFALCGRLSTISKKILEHPVGGFRVDERQ